MAATIGAVIYLSIALQHLDSLITQSGQSSRSARLLQSLLISLDDAETGARGYIILGDTKYLEPYNAAVKDVPANITLLQTTPGVTASTREIAMLKTDSEQQMDILGRSVAAKQAGNEELTRDPVANDRSKSLMDELRSQISTIIERSLQTARPQYAAAHSRVQVALFIAIVLSAFVVAICAVIAWYFQRSILRERALESTKSEFLSLASHQLRTPATNVKQYIGLLLDGYLGKITDKQRKALEVAYNNNESEIRIMNDLLNVAKLDLERIQLRKQRINIVPIVAQVVKDYDQYVENRDQTITLKAPKEVVANVDRTYFRGVVEKLVDNAVRYSHDKTTISVIIQINPESNTFEVVVRDRGLGIQKREFSKLFMKFSRLSNEFSANTEGSGTGLYWVKQVVALHGGTIKVASTEGRGSKFTIRAPLT